MKRDFTIRRLKEWITFRYIDFSIGSSSRKCWYFSAHYIDLVVINNNKLFLLKHPLPIRIINMRAQHITFDKAIKTVLKDCKEF